MTPTETATILRKFAQCLLAYKYLWGASLPGIPTEVGSAVEAAIEMIERLEAAESDDIEQARLNGMGSEREATLMAKLEAAEKSDAESPAMYRKARDERDALRAAVRHEADCMEAAMAEIKSLRAKIEQMERQVPYAFAVTFPETARVELVNDLDALYEDMITESYEVRKLYLAPGAKGEGNHERTE